MEFEQKALIDDLIGRTRDLVARAERMGSLPADQLNYRNAARSWGALDCLEHLNLYGDFYLEEIESSIRKSATGPGRTFTSGRLGGYFAESMLPREKGEKKVKTFRNMNPLHAGLSHATLDRYLEQQNKMIELLEAARQVDLDKVKVPLSVARFIKLKLGDVFRIITHHNQRHMAQAEAALESWELAGMFV